MTTNNVITFLKHDKDCNVRIFGFLPLLYFNVLICDMCVLNIF